MHIDDTEWQPLDKVNLNEFTCVVYCVKNNVNGKLYVGKTKGCLRRRIDGHVDASLKWSNYAFHRAIRKYGKEAFTLSVLESCNLEGLNEREVHYIASLCCTLLHKTRRYHQRLARETHESSKGLLFET